MCPSNLELAPKRDMRHSAYIYAFCDQQAKHGRWRTTTADTDESSRTAKMTVSIDPGWFLDADDHGHACVQNVHSGRNHPLTHAHYHFEAGLREAQNNPSLPLHVNSSLHHRVCTPLIQAFVATTNLRNMDHGTHSQRERCSYSPPVVSVAAVVEAHIPTRVNAPTRKRAIVL